MRVALGECIAQARVKVARAIAQARRECDVSAAELAAACGVSVRTVFRWEQARVDVSAARLHQVAKALGVPVDHIVT